MFTIMNENVFVNNLLSNHFLQKALKLPIPLKFSCILKVCLGNQQGSSAWKCQMSTTHLFQWREIRLVGHSLATDQSSMFKSS